MNLIQLGTNTGNDHVLEFVKLYNNQLDNIILVEPISELNNTIKENYKDYNIKINNSAIIPSNWNEGKINLFIVKPNDKARELEKSWEYGLPGYMSFKTSTLDENWIIKEDAYYKEYGSSIKVDALYFDTLISLYGISKVDFLFLDIEGIDCILLDSLDLSKYEFKFIYWEDVKKSNNLEIKLKDLGYKIIQSNDLQKIAYKKEYENYIQNFR
jgi:hypothetical protein